MDNAFELLEGKVRKAVDLVRRLRRENRSLEDELGKVRGRLQQAEKRLETEQHQSDGSAEAGRRLEPLKRELEELRKERAEVRARIVKLVEVLESLD